ncbi:hypothetical protein Tco_0533976 [Tanacetum coccineum]
MAESSPKKTSSPEITPKEEPATLDKPESPNPFLPASQVDFTFDESCTLKAFTRAPNQYKEYVSEVWYTTKTLDDSKVCISSPTGGVRGDIGGKTGGLNQISNKDATILYCLANGLQVDYAKIIWEDLIHKLNKKTREKIIPYPSFFHLHSESASGHDASGMDEGTKNYSFDHIFAGSNPSVLVDKTKSAGDGLKTTHTDSGANEESRADDISLNVKIEDLSDLLKDTRSVFFTPDSPPNEPIIISDESEEEEEVLIKLLVTSLKHELSKLFASHDFASCLPTKLKEIPSKITGLSGEIKELKNHVRGMEIELLGDLKEILTKLEIFTSTISISSIQEKLKTLDSLPSILHKVTDTLNRFATMVENASGATSMNVPSAGKATASPAEGEKNTKDAETNLQKQLINLLGFEVPFSKEAAYSPTGHSKKKKKSGTAKDKAPSQPSVSTPIDTELHKEDLQAAGDPTSLEVASEEGTHPQLSSGYDALIDSTAKADPGKSAPRTNLSVLVDKTKSAGDGLKIAHTVSGTNEESRFKEMSKKIKMEDLLNLMQDTRSAFFTPDSSPDEPIIVSDESEEEQTKRHEEPKDTLLEQQKAKAKAKVASLKAKPSYPDINQLTELLELNRHVQGMEIELPGDLNDIPTKLETFTSTASNLMSQVTELKTLKWEFPEEFLALQSQILSVQAKLQTLDILPSLLNKVANTLNRFASIMKNASHTATRKGVPSVGLATALPDEEEKNTNPATKDADTTNLHNKLVDLLGLDIVNGTKLRVTLDDKSDDKMLKRRKSSKTINYNVLIQKGPITLQIYREDGTIEVVPNIKGSDLHLVEWRKVVQACPNIKEKG